MQVFTIGFTKKTAQQFFGLLQQPGLRRVVDTRLNNGSQLAGFAKQEDLRFFLKEISKIDYVHLPQLAPTRGMLDDYRNDGRDWEVYQTRFLRLLAEREVENTMDPALLSGACLLCSESTPHHCHRRLVAEYFKGKWGDVNILHL